ncbi:MAG TPA: hypothetical protein DEQ61_13815 [Streptomyces sp.]|nr:hypothetical protein [Streptomyces sp.]
MVTSEHSSGAITRRPGAEQAAPSAGAVPGAGTAPSALLREALRDGPFATALDRAIRASGLSMERIQGRLAARGVTVSVTTLSYWRHGRSRPERPQSRQAIRLLEELLTLPDDSLVSLLGPRRPRGRWMQRQPANLEPERLWAGYQSLSGLLDEVGNPDDGLTRLAVHDRYELDANGAEARLTASVVVRAEREHVDRYVLIMRGDEPGRQPPELTDVRNARPGRIRTDHSVPLIVAELFLDRVLAKGETEIIEYSFSHPVTGRATDECGRGFRAPASLYTLEVSFHPSAAPVRCHRCAGSAASGSLPALEPVWISASGRAHMVVQDPAPGFHSLRWEWE